jgi:hypothetical protein
MTDISVFRTTALGALGIFLLYYGCMSTPVGHYAVVFLAMALAIAWFVNKSAQGT